MPELFPFLRNLVDKEKRKRKILILGSASKDLIQKNSESLAGRISYIQETPFTYNEISKKDHSKLWQRGGFPLSFLAKTEKESYQWRKSYISTFLKRDIPTLGITVKIPEARQLVFNRAEIDTLLYEANKTSHPFYNHWAMALLTGMRKGELHALNWTDIDFENKVISVKKTGHQKMA
jgi:predicted AAA+ superfamily ATPase